MSGILSDRDRESLERARREFRERRKHESKFRAQKVSVLEAEVDELRAALASLVTRIHMRGSVEERPRLPSGLSRSVEEALGQNRSQ
jgi:hypothetical protein